MVSFDLNFIYDINIDFSMVWVGIGLDCYRINIIMDLISMILPSYLQHIGWWYFSMEWWLWWYWWIEIEGSPGVVLFPVQELLPSGFSGVIMAMLVLGMICSFFHPVFPILVYSIILLVCLWFMSGGKWFFICNHVGLQYWRHQRGVGFGRPCWLHFRHCGHSSCHSSYMDPEAGGWGICEHLIVR